MEPLIDFSYTFMYDNPFDNDGAKKEKMTELKKEIMNNSSYFIDDNNDVIKFLDIDPNINMLYGKKIENRSASLSTNPILNDIKKFLSEIPELQELYLELPYTQNNIEESNISVCEEEDNVEESQNEENNGYQEEYNETSVLPEQINLEDYIPNLPDKYSYSKTSGLTNYDITNEKALTYEDIRKLTVNIARSKLVPDIQKDEQILQLEKQKRKELINKIMRYKNLRQIASIMDDDISKMDIIQLEQTVEQCKRVFDQLKLMEVCKRGMNFGGTLYNTIAPNGIPISKTKRLVFKGAGKEIINTLFDTQNVVGNAVANMIQKYNWNISDEALALLTLGEILISHVEIKEIEQPKEEKIQEKIIEEEDKYEEDEEEDNA